MRAEIIEIALCCDDTYLQPLLVAISSILARAQSAARLRFWIVSRTLDAHRFAPALDMIARAGAQSEVVPIKRLRSTLRGVPLSRYLTEATYYRLLLPDLLPPSVSRLIYLDCDIVVRRDLADLWAIDLLGHSTGAVRKPAASNFADIGLESARDYFNAGVLVIDLARWRRDRIHERALQFAKDRVGRLLFHDQDALNHVLRGHWRHLDLRWNQQFRFFMHTAARLGVPRRTLDAVRRDPFIVHFTTASKPWHYANDHPWSAAYFAHLDTTIYRGWRPSPRNFRERLRRNVRRILPHHLRPGVLRDAYRPHFHRLKSAVRRGLRLPT